jgi:nitroimidazol reductase NimA-like FMN-containing flavoprotein (pyridoxamine 5'-phosphate oxidase superfamily)
MNKKKLPPQITEVLKESHFAYLCTTDQNNQPHITPMFFIFDEETKDIFVVTSRKSKKMKNIQVNPQVSLTVDVRDPDNPFNNRGVMVQGRVVIEKTLDSLSVAKDIKLIGIYKEFNKKYPILSEAKTSAQIEYQEFSETLVRVHADKMVYWRGPYFITVNFKR